MTEASAALKKYIEELLAWENWYSDEQKDARYKTDGDFIDETKNKSRVRLNAILSQMLTDKAYSTIGQANLATQMTGQPRVYAQEIISSTESSTRKAVVITKNQESPTKYLQYSMTAVDGVWKIDNVKSSYDQVEWMKKHSI